MAASKLQPGHCLVFSKREICAGFGEYRFGEDLFGGSVVIPNEQAEHIIVSIATVAKLSFI